MRESLRNLRRARNEIQRILRQPAQEEAREWRNRDESDNGDTLEEVLEDSVLSSVYGNGSGSILNESSLLKQHQFHEKYSLVIAALYVHIYVTLIRIASNDCAVKQYPTCEHCDEMVSKSNRLD